MIQFNHYDYSSKTIHQINKYFASHEKSKKTDFLKETQDQIKKNFFPNAHQVFLTTSGTSAIELAFLSLDLNSQDEVILPSYSFVSCALPVANRFAKLVFTDVDKNLNIDIDSLKSKITNRTKAILFINYAGYCANLVLIKKIAKKEKIYLIEDNSHAFNGHYQNKPLGTYGDIAIQSFSEKKNLSCEEGGALIVNNKRLLMKCWIGYEKGTNRFSSNNKNSFSWIGKGGGFRLSQLGACILLSELQSFYKNQKIRKKLWHLYYSQLLEWSNINKVQLPSYPDKNISHGYHIFYLICPSKNYKFSLQSYLNRLKVEALSHYTPLHQSPMMKKMNCSNQEKLPISENYSNRLLRLPLWHGLSVANIHKITKLINNFKY